MATNITIDSEQVLGIATQIENDNRALLELLDKSKSTILALSASWTGAAADETRASYESFSSKYFQQYHDVLEQYVKFLRKNVAEGYAATETGNTKLADSFRS